MRDDVAQPKKQLVLALVRRFQSSMPGGGRWIILERFVCFIFINKF